MAKGRLREKLEALEGSASWGLTSASCWPPSCDASAPWMPTLRGSTQRWPDGFASYCRDDRGRDGHRHGPMLLGPGSVLATTAVPTSPSEARSRRATPPFSRLWWTARAAARTKTYIGSPIPPPRTPHRRQQGRHGRCPLHCCHAPLHHQEQVSLSWTWDTNTLRCATRPPSPAGLSANSNGWATKSC